MRWTLALVSNIYDVNNMGDIKQDNINRKNSDIKKYIKTMATL